MVTTKGVVTAGQVRGNSTVLARDVQNPFRYGEIKVSNFPNNLHTSSETVLSKFNYSNALNQKWHFSVRKSQCDCTDYTSIKQVRLFTLPTGKQCYLHKYLAFIFIFFLLNLFWMRWQNGNKIIVTAINLTLLFSIAIRYTCMHVCEVTSVVSNFATSWTGHQAPLSMGFSR